jgi:polyphenol oxidase
MQPLQPVWPAPPGVRAACSTRAGGVSQGPFESLNLGDHVQDDPSHVAVNRGRWAHAIGATAVFLRQVHGTRILRLGAERAAPPAADGCVSTRKGVACTILVADCLPILLCDAQGRAVAAAHAGWRGLAGVGPQSGPEATVSESSEGIVETVVRALADALDCLPAQAAPQLMAWLGPCIGPRAFEVGPEVKAAFERGDPTAASLFRPHGPGKWLANLPGLARRRLARAGVRQVHGNDGSTPWCTVANPSRYFSYRRDGACGRFAASIWLE